jgi:threonine dehydrogenase-like Zn-dependent dehydrogenase
MQAHQLNDTYPLDLAPLIEPVACALAGVDRLDGTLGRSAAVLGAGPIGLTLSILLEIAGFRPIALVDPNPIRRQSAEVIFGHPVLPELEPGREFDVVVDASGSPAAQEQAVEFAAPGGSVLLFGVAPPAARIQVSTFEIYRKELTILGSVSIRNTFSRAVDVIERHAAKFEGMVSRSYTIESFSEALGSMRQGHGQKLVIAPNMASVRGGSTNSDLGGGSKR